MKTDLEEINILFMSYADIRFKAEISAREVEIHWGDGNISTYSGESFYTITRKFTCEGMQSIRISGTDITSLNVSRLSLTALSLLNCPNLEYLDCSVNELDRLDFSKCPRLEEIYCNSNNLQRIDLTGLTHLRQANLSYNALQSLDITPCKKLQNLFCSNNHLIHFVADENVPLEYLNLGYNLLSKNQLTQIYNIMVRSNRNATLRTSQNPGSE